MDAEEYLKKETLEVISEIVEGFDETNDKIRMPPPKSDHYCEIVGLGLKGTIQVLNIPTVHMSEQKNNENYFQEYLSPSTATTEPNLKSEPVEEEDEEIDFTDIDDSEIGKYINALHV